MTGGYTGRWLLAAGSLLLTLLLLEGLLRLDYRRKVRETLAGRTPDQLITEADPALLYRLRADHELTNSNGFRDVERRRAKPAGAYRIALIGDSVAMQPAIPLEELYFRRLQSDLDRRLGAGAVEVLNFGVTGYATSQHVAQLETVVLGFRPDALLWQFHHNDAADPVLDGANGGLGIYYGRPRLHLGRFVERRWGHLRRRRCLRAQGLTEIPGDLQLQACYWDRMGGLLERVRDIARRERLEVWCFVLPSWPEGDDWRSYTMPGLRIHRRLVDRFVRLGFPTLDLLESLGGIDPAALRRSPDDPWHPNSAGHAWIAARLADWLAPLLASAGVRPGSSQPATRTAAPPAASPATPAKRSPA